MPGQAPGLSTWATLEQATAPGGKAQVIDLDRLAPPLVGLPDEVAKGGEEGHVSILPITADDEIDMDLLREWASSRGTGTLHWLTEIVRDSIVELNARRPR